MRELETEKRRLEKIAENDSQLVFLRAQYAALKRGAKR